MGAGQIYIRLCSSNVVRVVCDSCYNQGFVEIVTNYLFL